MKKILLRSSLVGTLLVIIVSLFYPRLSTKIEFDLKPQKYTLLKQKAENGNLYAIERLYQYYHYSTNEYNKSIEILREGAKLGDSKLQYKLSLYFIRDYYPYGRKESFKEEGIYWLNESAKQKHKSAMHELKIITERITK